MRIQDEKHEAFDSKCHARRVTSSVSLRLSSKSASHFPAHGGSFWRSLDLHGMWASM